MKNIKLIIIVSSILFVFFIGYFFVYTTMGSQFLAKQMISKYVGHEDMGYKNLQGTLASGLTFQNIEIKEIKNLPEGSVLKIQRLFINLTSYSLNGVDVEIENIRLKLPYSDPIVISGTFKKEQLDFNIYSKGFTVTEVLSYLPDFKKLIPINGEVNAIDLFISGHYQQPIVKGGFTIDKFIYKGFILNNAELNMDIKLKDVKSDVKLYGNVTLEKGELKTKKVSVNLNKGNLNFLGLWNQPSINLKANATVEKTKINIGLRGTIEKPELTLNSEPPYSQQKIMVMLATGKKWQSVEDSMDNGLNSAELTKDFIDYFFFAGKSNKFAERYGISEFSVKFDEDKKGIAAKKEISENVEVGYGIEKSNGEDQSKNMTQKLEGEFKINEKISIGIEREIKQKDFIDTINVPPTEKNDKVMIKYKKSF